MALSKSSRIILLLVIDSAFFLLEIASGYAVHSLALVADSFHMLNDVLSLCVGLWAVKVAQRKTSSQQLKRYTYGWQRAETLGALVNGVFLVALCVTIFLDAIQRFVEPQVVTNPQLVLIVGCLGLASNLIGLVLFHDHSHSHGPGGHSHGHADGHDHEVGAAEEGHSHVHAHDHQTESSPHSSHNHSGSSPHPQTDGSEITAVDDENPIDQKRSRQSQPDIKRRLSRSGSRTYSSIDDIYVNPNRFRRSIIDASITRLDPLQSEETTSDEGFEAAVDDEDDTHTHSAQPLLLGHQKPVYGSTKRKSIDHRAHKHAQPKEAGGGHGHSHGDLNMRGIFLHVMGDALGNIGVIATALIIWLTDVPWRFYFDPAISLVITCIILGSAIPLCKAASRILLQAVPAGINVDDIREDVEALPGILSCHHLHVWQLSDTKLVASLHVQLAFDIDNFNSARYMHLAQAIRTCLHEYGIHSSTIQPEFCLDPDHDHVGDASERNGSTAHAHDHAGESSMAGSHGASKAGSVRDPDPCLLECGDECGGGKGCCEPASKDGPSPDGHGA